MAQDVFISYSHKDKAIADAICANLENARVRGWIAPRDIAPGLDWPTAISKAIEASRIMVLVFSANSNTSNEVSRELILAANNNLIIIPFKIDDIRPEPGKQYYLARTHWLDAMNPPTQEQIDTLVSHVKVFLGELEAGGRIEPIPEAVPPPVRIAALPVTVKKASPKAEKQKAGQVSRSIWIWGSLSVLVLIAGGIYAMSTIGGPLKPASSTATPSHTPASTYTDTPSFTSSPTTTISPTRTPVSTSTAIPPPAWVTDFAGPILAAIADLPPTFQDDFGAGSAGWQSEDWCGNNIDYVQEELVITKCRAFRPNISYNDFVIKFDVRFLPGADQNERFGFSFKNISGIGDGHSVSIMPNGDGWINYQSGSRPTDNTTYKFKNAAHPNLQSNHILVIGKGSGFAIYLNDRPLYFFESSIRPFGNFGFDAGGTIAAIDNVKAWNIANIAIP